jgi:enterochelin esterase family protein
MRYTPPLLVASLFAAAAARGQMPKFNSHEVNPDHSLTLRYYAPESKSVIVTLDFDASKKVPLAKGPDGVWSMRTAPLEPAVHAYAFDVDGVHVADPLNSSLEDSPIYYTNLVEVPGEPRPWTEQGAPHGIVHHHSYSTSEIRHMPGGIEDYFVYTPPGYDPAAPAAYPTLYLLHGWSSRGDSWITDGQADHMLDNLMARGAIASMVVVMPTCYGDFDFVTKGFGQWSDESRIADNMVRFSAALRTEIIPQVEASYRVGRTRDSRAIAGLSMGGAESLVIGLGHPETFGWVAGLSSAMVYDDFSMVLPGLKTASPRFHLLWISCATGDKLIGPNRKFAAWLRTQGIVPTVIETAGIHNWPVWRDNFLHFAPLLFRPSAAN